METGRAAPDTRGDFHGAFVFALLAAFALLSLAVVVVGARSYRKIVQTADETQVYRTGMSYLLGKARGANEAGMVGVRLENGADVLVLGGEYGGERYNTYIFCENGQVKEYFAAEGQSFDSSYGETILSADSLRLRLEGGLLSIVLTDAEGGEYSASVYLAAEGGGAS